MKHEEEFARLIHLTNKSVDARLKEELSAELAISASTLYRRLEKIKERPVASVLKPQRRGPKIGSKRIDLISEALMEEVIKSKYLVKQKPRISKCYLHLIEHFDRAGIKKVPSSRTFRRRIKKLTKAQLRNGRMYASERNSKHSSKTQHFTSNAPMDLVQIDHTKLNAIIISSIDGSVLGRVIFTVITDIHTGLVLGFLVHLYGPNHENVSQALAHACFDKTQYLEDLGIKGEWVNLGLPIVLHMDNAAEFKSKAMAHGCGEYGIERKYRPIGKTHYGGHVESLVKTLNEVLRDIPGATFASIKEKGDYPSEKLACFTLPMIEKYITNFIVNYYHKRPHSRLGISPMQKYQHAVDNGFTPRLPPKSKSQFIADFSESKMRTVRDLGIEFECKEYWSPYVASLYNQNIQEVRVLPIAETVKVINILGPDNEIHEVTAKDLSLPDVTRREWKRYQKIVRERNNDRKMTNREIAYYIRQENEIDCDAKRESKRLRRAHESQHIRKTNLHPKPSIPTSREQNDNILFDSNAAFKTHQRDAR